MGQAYRAARSLEDTSGGGADAGTHCRMRPATMDRIETGWLRDAMVAFRDETVLYLRTCAGFAFGPRRFLAEWSAGTRRAQTPSLPWRRLSPSPPRFNSRAIPFPGQRKPPEAGSPFWRGVLQAAGPYTHYLLLGLASHAAPALRRSRTSARASLAATLYSGGISILAIGVLYLFAASAFPALRPEGDVSRADANAFAAASSPSRPASRSFSSLLVAALARTHGVSAWLSAMAVGCAGRKRTGFGALRRRESYGLHPVACWIEHATQPATGAAD